MKRFPINCRSHYYSGSIHVVVPDEDELIYESLRLEWNGYEGGGATIELNWDEVSELREVLAKVYELKPEWW